jgi:hypothetical protein
MERSELKACPFCGGDAFPDKTLRDGYEDNQTGEDAWAHFIRCRCCAACGPWYKRPGNAVTFWNCRRNGK